MHIKKCYQYLPYFIISTQLIYYYHYSFLREIIISWSISTIIFDSTVGVFKTPQVQALDKRLQDIRKQLVNNNLPVKGIKILTISVCPFCAASWIGVVLRLCVKGAKIFMISVSSSAISHLDFLQISIILFLKSFWTRQMV